MADDSEAPSLLLRARVLRKSYAAPVLIDVDLDVESGEVHALVGANGAGKTTLARILCGLTTMDGGSIELLGRKVSPRAHATQAMVEEHQRRRLGRRGAVSGYLQTSAAYLDVLRVIIHVTIRRAALSLTARASMPAARAPVQTRHFKLMQQLAR